MSTEYQPLSSNETSEPSAQLVPAVSPYPPLSEVIGKTAKATFVVASTIVIATEVSMLLGAVIGAIVLLTAVYKVVSSPIDSNQPIEASKFRSVLSKFLVTAQSRDTIAQIGLKNLHITQFTTPGEQTVTYIPTQGKNCGKWEQTTTLKTNVRVFNHGLRKQIPEATSITLTLKNSSEEDAVTLKK